MVARNITMNKEFREKLESELELLSAEASINGMDKSEFMKMCESIYSTMNAHSRTGVRKQVRYWSIVLFMMFLVFRAYDNTYLQIHSFFQNMNIHRECILECIFRRKKKVVR